MPVDMNGMLLRGTTLKNSGRIVGLVVYTGPESRIQMNAAPPPRKRGAHAGCTALLAGLGVNVCFNDVLVCAARAVECAPQDLPCSGVRALAAPW